MEDPFTKVDFKILNAYKVKHDIIVVGCRAEKCVEMSYYIQSLKLLLKDRLFFQIVCDSHTQCQSFGCHRYSIENTLTFLDITGS